MNFLYKRGTTMAHAAGYFKSEEKSRGISMVSQKREVRGALRRKSDVSSIPCPIKWKEKGCPPFHPFSNFFLKKKQNKNEP